MPTRWDPGHLRLLGTLLAMPEEGACEALREVVPQAPWLAGVLGELQSLPLERWQAEHTRLFISGYPKTLCPPFESAYRQGQMGGSVAGDLRRFYLRVGLQPDAAAPDYLGTILDCAAYLADTSRSGREPEAAALLHDLWDEHLSRWLPRFAQDLQLNARLSLYRQIGEQLGQLCLGLCDGH